MPVAEKVKQIIVEQLGVDESQVDAEKIKTVKDAIDYIEAKKK
jgi:acyl carrier protein